MFPQKLLIVVTSLGLVLSGALSMACSDDDSDDDGNGSTTPAAATGAAVASPSASGTGATAGPGQGGGNAAGTEVQATESDFKIELDNTSAGAGDVTFQIQNDGPSTHEFVVVKTSLAAGELPVAAGVVDEDSDELEGIDEIEDIAVGTSEELTLDLNAGHYVLFCNIAGHYTLGMHTDFEVQ